MPVQRYLILIERDRLGTAEYVSPELLKHNICGFESDIWAVGVYYINSLMAFRRLKEAPST